MPRLTWNRSGMVEGHLVFFYLTPSFHHHIFFLMGDHHITVRSLLNGLRPKIIILNLGCSERAALIPSLSSGSLGMPIFI